MFTRIEARERLQAMKPLAVGDYSYVLTAYAFHKMTRESAELRDQLLSCAALLETMAKWAEEEGHEVEQVMMSVMADSSRRMLEATRGE